MLAPKNPATLVVGVVRNLPVWLDYVCTALETEIIGITHFFRYGMRAVMKNNLFFKKKQKKCLYLHRKSKECLEPSNMN